MKLLKTMRFGALYTAWAALFVLTAALGLCFPAAEGGLKALLLIISILFFLPPWLILQKARRTGNDHHRKLVGMLAALSLVMTTALICLNILSFSDAEGLGDVLHVVLTVVSAPMVCSNFFAVPLFLWAVLLMASFFSKKEAKSAGTGRQRMAHEVVCPPGQSVTR